MNNDTRNDGSVTAPIAVTEPIMVETTNRWWRRKRRLYCPMCGIETHRESRFWFIRKKWVPRTVEGRVLSGRCLSCNPNTTVPHADIDSDENTLVTVVSDLTLDNMPRESDIYEEGFSYRAGGEQQHWGESATLSPPFSARVTLATINEQAPFMSYNEESPVTEKFLCCICLREEFNLSFQNNVACINCCQHRFCFECINEWAKHENTCPLCKARFNCIFPLLKMTLDDGSARLLFKRVHGRNQDPEADIVPLATVLMSFNDSENISVTSSLTNQNTREFDIDSDDDDSLPHLIARQDDDSDSEVSPFAPLLPDTISQEYDADTDDDNDDDALPHHLFPHVLDSDVGSFRNSAGQSRGSWLLR